MPLLFPKLAAALAEFDRTAPDREKRWDEAETDAAVAKARAADAAAEQAVREAFANEPRNPNTLRNSMLLSLDTARRFARCTVEEDEA